MLSFGTYPRDAMVKRLKNADGVVRMTWLTGGFCWLVEKSETGGYGFLKKLAG